MTEEDKTTIKLAIEIVCSKADEEFEDYAKLIKSTTGYNHYLNHLDDNCRFWWDFKSKINEILK